MRCIRSTTLCATRSHWPMGWEFGLLIARMALSIGLVAVASLGAATIYEHRNAAPACTNEWTLGRISEILRDKFHLDSIIVNDIRTVSGGFFGSSHDCTAEVAEIRSGEDAASMVWQEIRYRIVHQDGSEPSAITLELAGRVPLAPQPRSVWTRLLAHL